MSYRWGYHLNGRRRFPRISFHCLAPPGDAKGASCDENGPAIGPIRLSTKTAAGFAPRPVGELNQLFAHVVEGPVDCADLVERLTGIAKALNRSDFARATLRHSGARAAVNAKHSPHPQALA
jgi:hypothetical protein